MPDTAARTAPSRTGPNRLTPADIFAFRNATDPRIAPDASAVCFVLVERDIITDRKQPRLMLSSNRATPRPIEGSGGAETPRWAPDSRRLAFLRKRDDRTEIMVADTQTGELRALTEPAPAVRDLAWSPDGRHLAWQQRVPAGPAAWLDLPQPPEGATWGPPARITERLIYRHDAEGDLTEGAFQVFLADTVTGTTRQLTTGDWHSGFLHGPGLTWSADGAAVILSASRRPDWDTAPNDIDLHAIDVTTGAVAQLTRRPGADALPTVLPDGRIAFTGVERAGTSAALRRLYMLPAGGEAQALLPDLDRAISGIGVGGDTLVVGFEDEGGGVIARVAPDGSLTRLVRDLGGGGIENPYSSGSFSVALDGTIAYTRSTTDTPCEVAVIAPDGAVTTITELNSELAARVGGFVPATGFRASASLDGATIQCWLLRPRDAAPTDALPLILDIHGGPFASFGDRFSVQHQCFLAAGYAVLFINPRGSVGYGEAFAQALHDRHPGPDWQDLMDGLDAAIAAGGIDPARLYVTGASGGGVLTLWSVTHTKRFRAAVSVKPVVNQESWSLTADIGAWLGELWFSGVRPWVDRQKYLDRSPLAFVQHAATPTMLIAGERDSRTPITEAQQMYAALKLCGVPAALVSMPDVRHASGSMRPSAIATDIACKLSWFARFA